MHEHSNHTHLYTGSFIVIQRLQLDLQDAEIPFLTKNNNESAKLAGFGSLTDNVQLFVFQQDLEKSKKILENFLSETN